MIKVIFSQKKYKAKLKEELKKELLAEIKKEQIKEQQKLEKKKNVPVKVNNSKEDLEEIRQKLFPAVILVITLMVLLILLLMYGGNLNFLDRPSENNVIEEKIDEEYLPLKEFEVGEIPLNNSELRYITNEIELKYAEFVIFNTRSLFEKNHIAFSSLSSQQQLYLMGKTNRFNNYVLDHKLDNVAMVCYKNGAITVGSSRVEEIMKSEFNIDFTEHTSFDYEYFLGDSLLTNIKFEYENGIYSSRCISVEEQKANSQEVRVENRVMSATKTEDTLEFDVKVVFETKDGFYSDYLLTNKIENFNNVVNLDYVLYGSDWKYIYKLNETGDYYLYSIQNVTQAQ